MTTIHRNMNNLILSQPKTDGQITAQSEHALPVETQQVILSDEAKALSAATQSDEQQIGEKIESFTRGALGMQQNHQQLAERDNSYSAGQYLKGALAIGAMVLAVV